MGFINNLFGNRKIKKIEPIVSKIESYSSKMEELSDEELKSKTIEFKKRLSDGETLDDILPEAFAVAREASKRVIGLYPYHVQLVGGVVIHQGRIAEMATGEGKTLVALMPSYLNALSGKSVHVVTVNDYLAKRDADQIGRVHKFLGLTVGYITHDVPLHKRKEMYKCDIIYGTNNEFGFDYLRDNMVKDPDEIVQRDLTFAIVDEVDSILIDEARTPLIISKASDIPSSEYTKADILAKKFRPMYVSETESKEVVDDYDCDVVIDEKHKGILITTSGYNKIEKYYGIDDCSAIENTEIMHFVTQAIKANFIMKRDSDYLIKDGKIIIIDEFTGRLMFGRRYNDGLHQAIEAKENVEINKESVTMATITFQNYFRMYNKLSGMTGTAMTEEAEFGDIYSLDVVAIPTNKPVIRKDYSDAIYANNKAKINAIVNQIKDCYERKQPVLIGTTSVSKSEELSNRLNKEKIPHNVLNAKYHEIEAEIIAEAGRYGAVTIATNMAGRGTDIMLGGNPEQLVWKEKIKPIIESKINEINTILEEIKAEEHVKPTTEEMEYNQFIDTLENLQIADIENYKGTDEFINEISEIFHRSLEVQKAICDEEHNKVVETGGLFIIGTERHESRRIDNQLRGRSGRQGDPGESKFFISMEDDLLRLFGGDTIKRMMERLNIDDDIPIEGKAISNSVENAQKSIESNNFAIRKNVLKFDDVINKQREIIYRERREVMTSDNLDEHIFNMIHKYVDESLDHLKADGETITEDFINEIFSIEACEYFFENPDEITRGLAKEKFIGKNVDEFIYKAKENFYDIYRYKILRLPDEIRTALQRDILINEVDKHWIDQIDAMDQLQKGIFLRAYAQDDPYKAYQCEGMEMFDEMNSCIVNDTVIKLISCKFTICMTTDTKLESNNEA